MYDAPKLDLYLDYTGTGRLTLDDKELPVAAVLIYAEAREAPTVWVSFPPTKVEVHLLGANVTQIPYGFIDMAKKSFREMLPRPEDSENAEKWRKMPAGALYEAYKSMLILQAIGYKQFLADHDLTQLEEVLGQLGLDKDWIKVAKNEAASAGRDWGR